ncbi:hypothetical protein KSB_59580 [Ktedonobacter robiniae]|uniref:Uncharacterized protein n=1 Tax=Ktedonobacter robiniae TaxID=2778365 RepID=A0ABQ3UXU2_9CHLR|nr:hypothetical protein KSB_59580 [Ktedonobacter robiniae]
MRENMHMLVDPPCFCYTRSCWGVGEKSVVDKKGTHAKATDPCTHLVYQEAMLYFAYP